MDINKCPYCGNINTDSVDCEEFSQKMICRNCNQDYIIWYNENEEVIEITDRNNRKVC
jgi:uncharacterized protein YbaR (Trm112 family)